MQLRFAAKLAVAGSIALLYVPHSVRAADNFEVAVRAAACNACHGPNGHSEAGIPPLAGRPAQYLYETLLEFKNGKRSAFVMHQHTRGYSDQELKDIAAYFESRPAKKSS